MPLEDIYVEIKTQRQNRRYIGFSQLAAICQSRDKKCIPAGHSGVWQHIFIAVKTFEYRHV